MPLLAVKDEFSYIFGWRLRNETFVSQLAIVQFVVAAVSLAQHVYSLIAYQVTAITAKPSTQFYEGMIG